MKIIWDITKKESRLNESIFAIVIALNKMAYFALFNCDCCQRGLNETDVECTQSEECRVSAHFCYFSLILFSA